MTEPFLSIVIPVYDPPINHFRKCIASIKSNLTDEIEVILVDDCSPSKDYMAEIRGMDCQVIINAENMRQGLSRQVGLDACRGKYITFMDQDDTFDPHILPLIVARLKDSKCKCQYRTKTRIVGSVKGETYSRFCDEMLHGNFFNVEYLRQNDIHFSAELEESSEDTYFMSILGMSGFDKADHLLLDDTITYNWFIWTDSTSHKEGNDHTYFERTFKDYCDAHILTMTWFKEHRDVPDYITIRGCYLVMAFFFTCDVFDYRHRDTEIRSETKRFFNWLVDFMDVTFDELYELILKYPYTYSESYMKQMERYGEFVPKESVKDFINYWKKTLKRR